MAVTTTTTRHSFSGSGSAFSSGATPSGQGPFSINFTIIDAVHIQVYWTKGSSTPNGTPISSGDFTAGSSGYLVKDVHYTVQNAGSASNASITWVESGFTVSSTVIFPTSNDTLVITRNVPLTQVTNYQNNATIDAETIEQSFDKLTQTAQQLDDGKDYSFKFASNLAGATGFNSTAETAGTLNVNKADRISKGIKFNSNGDIGVSTYDPDEQVTLATAQVALATTQANNASTSATLAGNYATKVDGVVTGSDHSSKAWAIGGTGVTDTSSKGASKEWAIETSSSVDTSEYSAKEYAVGTQRRGQANGGSSKDWATYTSGTVDNADYSAKYWALDAEQSKLSAKASASAVASVFDSFDDTYLGKTTDAVSFTADASTDFLTSNAHGLVDTQIIRVSGSDLPSGLSASTDYYVRDKTTNTFKLATSSGGTAINIADNGSGTNTWYHADFTTPTSSSWSANSSVITVASNVGVRVGQVVTGSGIGTSPKPNVVSIDGTSITISENMASAGSSVAVTFANKGVYGEYNTSKDGPSTDNDGDALKTGALYFNSTDNEMRVYDGANWLPATSAGSTSILIYKYSASGSQTTFTGSDANGATLSYVANNILVFLNGVKLDATDYTATNGTSVVLGSGATASDELVVVAFKSFTTADMVPASTGGTFSGNVSFGDNNITNVGSIALDSITADGSSITISTDTALASGVDIETSITGKIKQKGAFMQSSTHQALVLGY